MRLRELRRTAGLAFPPFNANRLSPTPALLFAALALSGCAHQVAGTVVHGGDSPGFLLGLWQGFIFPVAWLLSLFMPDIAVYAVPNDGGWYNFGYFLGIVVFGVGAHRGPRVIYRERVVVRDRGRVIDHE